MPEPPALAPQTPEGLARVVAILDAAFAKLGKRPEAAKDVYVALRATLDVLEGHIALREGWPEVLRLRAIADAGREVARLSEVR